MDYDLKIVGGTIIDGTGAAGFRGDVGVKDGRIVALGDAPGTAAETVEADQHIVAPGFVDIHTHYDAQIFWDRMLSISPWHGVTSVVMSNCGFGLAPTRPEHRDLMLRTLEKVEGMSLDALRAGIGETWPFETFPQYLDAVEARGMAINVACLFGHTPLRFWVMGEDAVKRVATEDEIIAMRSLVTEAVGAGALGFATSHAATHNGFDGHPVPSRLADFSEIDALVGAMAGAGGGLFQATIGRTLFHDQFIELARKHGVTVTWTALLAGMSGPGSHQKHQARTQDCVDQGLKIVPQVACRPLMFDFDFAEPFPFEARDLFKPTMTADLAGKKAIYASPDFRAAFKADSAPGAKNFLAGWAARAVISIAPDEPSWNEQPLPDIAARQGVDPINLALDMSIASDFAARFRFSVVNNDETEVAELLNDPNMVIALSDAGAHASQLCDACYATHFLGHWVRDKQAIGMERAVHMLTGRTAEVFGIRDRGRLASGYPADIVVFDPATVGAGPLRRVNDFPAGADRLIAEADGIHAVVVNGTVIRRDGVNQIDPAGDLPGRLLRGGAAA